VSSGVRGNFFHHHQTCQDGFLRALNALSNSCAWNGTRFWSHESICYPLITFLHPFVQIRVSRRFGVSSHNSGSLACSRGRGLSAGLSNCALQERCTVAPQRDKTSASDADRSRFKPEHCFCALRRRCPYRVAVSREQSTSPAEAPSVSWMLIQDTNRRQLWRSLSIWLASKPAR
jgi:hypothetical protein